MEAAARQEELQVLGQLLQERLQSEFPQAVPLQVRCAIKDGTLMVLSEHPASVTLDPPATFAALQQALQSLQPQVAQAVEVYLRVAGQKQPYAIDFFVLQPPVSLPIEEPVGLETSWENPASPADEYQTPNKRGETPPLAEVKNSDGSSDFSNSFEPLAPAPDLSSEIVPVKRFYEADTTSRWRQFKLPLPMLVAGAGVALAASLSGVYLLTRPCVISDCEPIQTAQQLSQESAQLTRRAKSQQQLTAAQQQLAEATDALQTIPGWSPRYQEAQQLSQTLSTQSGTLNQAVTALQKASAAAQKSQNTPHTVQEWQGIQALWREAITPLEAVPRNSTVYSLAQQKLPGYRANLKSVNQQLNAEQQAAKKLTKALATAQIATTRQGAAQSLQKWQQVQSTWQVAVNSLASIPTTSTAHKEAQQLLVTYRPKLAAAGDRTTKEQISAKAYNQAISLATLAQRYEQQNQLPEAVTNWSQALNAAKQVPTETFYHSKAQPIIDSYSSALKQAEDKLKTANILQKVRTDLNRTCSGSIQVCNYTLNSQGITVRLTSDYEEAVERSFITANVQGYSNSQSGVVNHYQTLRQALETISYNSTLPLQVYDAKGSLIHTYSPGIQAEE